MRGSDEPGRVRAGWPEFESHLVHSGCASGDKSLSLSAPPFPDMLKRLWTGPPHSAGSGSVNEKRREQCLALHIQELLTVRIIRPSEKKSKCLSLETCLEAPVLSVDFFLGPNTCNTDFIRKILIKPVLFNFWYLLKKKKILLPSLHEIKLL